MCHFKLKKLIKIYNKMDKKNICDTLFRNIITNIVINKLPETNYYDPEPTIFISICAGTKYKKIDTSVSSNSEYSMKYILKQNIFRRIPNSTGNIIDVYRRIHNGTRIVLNKDQCKFFGVEFNAILYDTFIL